LLAISWKTNKFAKEWMGYHIMGIAYEYQRRFGKMHPAWSATVRWHSNTEVPMSPHSMVSKVVVDKHPIFPGVDSLPLDLVGAALGNQDRFGIPAYASGMNLGSLWLEHISKVACQFPQNIPTKYQRVDAVDGFRSFYYHKCLKFARWRYTERPRIWPIHVLNIKEIDL
jgi:hypothetical protein